ncbi:hypothetical protein B0H11DRAFT_1987778 [Mycena galericulata]|nr:hypothetical protein B0H11DRAFT_1987778 [Mycena galericulata]
MAESLTLHFSDYVRVAGEMMQGQVDVNVPKALEDKIENVRIKLRGSVVTKITETEHRAGGESETHYQNQTVELIRADQSIWDQFSSPQGVQVVSCPFQLQLPPNLPPSFHHSQVNRKVAISYSLEVIGSRHGLFHANRRIRRIFSVVPAATALELNANAALRQGWGGPWKPISTNREIRHGILFGDHSQVKMERIKSPSLQLVIPDLPLAILTHTKPVHRSDLEDKHGKLFPPPPASPADVELRVYRRGRMRVHHRSDAIEEHFDVKGSLGDAASVNAVRTKMDEPEWTDSPDHKGKGIWKRGVHFEGMLAETVEWNYALRIKADFPGIGNHLELEFPIRIDSGAACPPLPQSGYQSNVPTGTGDDHEWDEEK